MWKGLPKRLAFDLHAKSMNTIIWGRNFKLQTNQHLIWRQRKKNLKFIETSKKNILRVYFSFNIRTEAILVFELNISIRLFDVNVSLTLFQFHELMPLPKSTDWSIIMGTIATKWKFSKKESTTILHIHTSNYWLKLRVHSKIKPTVVVPELCRTRATSINVYNFHSCATFWYHIYDGHSH